MGKKLAHPYADLQGGTWLRGNLHSHTTASDGARSLNVVIQDYRDRGYGFLMVSDHDVYTAKKTLSEIEAGDLILIPGNEISANGNHVLHVNAGRNVAPNRKRQIVLNEIAADQNAFAVIPHPNWQNEFDYVTVGQLREWTGYAGIEIYNGVIGRLSGSPYATNKWDILLGQGYKFWGYANDDSHTAQDMELGWNHVYVKTRSLEAIVEALRAGRFYASTGVEIETIVVEGMRIRLESRNAERIVAVRDFGGRLAQADDCIIEVEVPETVKYVRFECWGRGERMAWTQPFHVVETAACDATGLV